MTLHGPSTIQVAWTHPKPPCSFPGLTVFLDFEMAITKYQYLTPEQREHFLQHGWIKIPKAVKEEYLKAFTENVWIRLGYDPDDKSTWTKEKVRCRAHNLPLHTGMDALVL